MEQAIDLMISSGVEEKTILLLLMIPIIATLVTTFRHFIGIKSFGIFTPVLLSVSFASISDDPKASIIYGLAITLATVLASAVLQSFLDANKSKIFRMHYLPKLGLIITCVSIALFFMLIIGAILGKSFVTIDPLPLVLIVMLIEDFSTKAFKKGVRSALTITLETIAISLIGYFLIIFKPLQELLFKTPEIVLITIPINLITGKYAGLRITELMRFSDIE